MITHINTKDKKLLYYTIFRLYGYRYGTVKVEVNIEATKSYIL